MDFLRKAFFYFWYWRNPPWDTHQTPPEVYEFIEKNLPGRALDLGCGTGTNAITLAKNGWQVIGVDFVEKPLRTARKKANQANLEIDFRRDDVTRMENILGPFDLILDIGCFHNLPLEGKQNYRKNIARLLGPNGTFMLYAFFQNNDTGSGNGIIESDLEAFSPTFKIVSRQDGTEKGMRPSVWLTFQRDK